MSEERYQSFRDLTQYQLRETAIIFITGAKKEKERKYAKDAEREKKKSKKISHNYTTKGNWRGIFVYWFFQQGLSSNFD